MDLSRREADFAIRGLKIDQRPPKDIVGVKLGLLTVGLYVHKKLLADARLGKRELTYIDTSEVLPYTSPKAPPKVTRQPRLAPLKTR